MNKCFFGDARYRLFDLALSGVKAQCCVTSPPYFGLRDYGHDGQLGLEKTPADYVANLAQVFALVWDVLADDGVLWLNLGDSYNARPGQRKTTDKAGAKQQTNAGSPMAPSRHVSECKPKDLIGIPWRVAFALQDAGWYLRQDIIWHKPNPMPESVTDRCTKAHEYLFMLTKNARYYFDNDAIKEDSVGEPPVSRMNNHAGTKRAKIQNLEKSTLGTPADGKRNRRSVWTIPTKPYKGAHFAVFPPALVEPCILAGSRPGDVVLDPFFGSGTVGEVAQAHGRKWIGCEINKEYGALQQQRVGGPE